MTRMILVVDDDASVRIVLGEFLAREGFDVQCASSGAEALEKIQNAPPDLVLLDMAMPGLNGLDTLKKLKAVRRRLPVMMITAYRDAEKVVDCFRWGASDCLFKPFDYAYLRMVVRDHLKGNEK